MFNARLSRLTSLSKRKLYINFRITLLLGQFERGRYKRQCYYSLIITTVSRAARQCALLAITKARESSEGVVSSLFFSAALLN